MNNATAHLVRLAALLLFQVLILNQVELSGYVTPFVHSLIILMLPLDMPILWLLLSAFGLGLAVDMFSYTIGMHAAASVWVAYIRRSVLLYRAPAGGTETLPYPSLSYMGFRWFVRYAGISLLLYHLLFFGIEVFSMHSLFYIIIKTLCSTALALLLVLVYQYLFEPKR